MKGILFLFVFVFFSPPAQEGLQEREFYRLSARCYFRTTDAKETTLA